MYKSDYEAFISNPIWKEIVTTLKETREGLIEDLKEMDPFADATNLARQQGRLKMLEFVLTEMVEDILREINERAREIMEEKDE